MGREPPEKPRDDEAEEREQEASMTRDPKKTNRNVIPRKDRED